MPKVKTVTSVNQIVKKICIHVHVVLIQGWHSAESIHVCVKKCSFKINLTVTLVTAVLADFVYYSYTPRMTGKQTETETMTL